MTYKMLVRAINLETNQELAQLVSESFIVSRPVNTPDC